MAISKQAVMRNACFGLYFFFCGVEYAVILPIINDYLRLFDADNTFLGIVLASFSFAGLVTAPIFGYVTDKTRRLKACIVVANLFEIVGNFTYFVGRSKYYVLGGRILAGLGSGAASSVFGTISRSTPIKKRTSMFALLTMLKQLGIVVGPGFNIFFLKLHSKIGPFEADSNTSAGLLMAILWTLHTIIFLIIYKDSRRSFGNQDALQYAQNQEEPMRSVENSATSLQPKKEVVFSIKFIQGYLREEIVVLLGAAFIYTLAQTGREAATTPMTLLYFGWHGFENSILLLASGGVVMIGFLSVHYASKRFSDKTLLLGGCIGYAFGFAIFLAYELVLYCAVNKNESPRWLLPVLCLNIVIWILGLSFTFVPMVSLFSKLTLPETQAFSQGIRIVATRVGMIMGPLWASPMVTPSRLPIMAAVSLSLLCLLIAMIIGSFKHLDPPATVGHPAQDDQS